MTKELSEAVKFALNKQDRAMLQNFDLQGIANIKNPDHLEDYAEIDLGMIYLDIAFVILQIEQHLNSLIKRPSINDWNELSNDDKSIYLHQSKKLVNYAVNKYIEKSF
jgi:hypothetical protein